MGDAAPAFTLFGTAHLTVLGLTVLIPVLLCHWARGSAMRTSRIAISIAAVLLVNKIAVFSYACIFNTVPWGERLPMHLCDWVSFITMVALVRPHQTLRDLTFFWGLAGTLQATLTPDLPFGFPQFYFFTFHISHSGILIAVAFMTLNMGYRPTLAGVGRAFAWLQVYLVSALTINWLLDQNYGYLCRKPVNPSLLDKLGDWPWYILSLELLAVVFFLCYLAPFELWKRMRTARPTSSPN